MAISSRRRDVNVDCVETVAEAEKLAKHNKKYRLMILDYRLPDSDGFSGLFRMQNALSHTPIALISAYDQPTIVQAARAIGAAGFLSKRQPLDQLAQSIDLLLDGKQVFPAVPDDGEELTVLRERLNSLSTAQMRVLAAVVKGHLNKQIAGDLDISESTVKAHMSAILRKLGVNNRVQAVLAVRPLFDPED